MAAQGGWQPFDWCPRDLKVGDHVGLLILSSGETWVVQNGVRAVKSPSKIPASMPLFPLIDLLGNTQGVSLVEAAQPPAVFHMQLAGTGVKVAKDGLSVRHKDPTGKDLNGMAFLNVPIPVFEDGAYFEVCVDEVCEGNMDGLTMGVTTAMPDMMEEGHSTADEVPNSWSMGFDGQACVNGRLTEIDWRPRNLKVGDHVGFLVLGDGAAWIVQNGAQVARLPATLPMDQPLHAFVDLMGNTTKVSLIQAAVPPAGDPVQEGAPGQDPADAGRNSSIKHNHGGFMSSLWSLVGAETASRDSTCHAFDRQRVSPLVVVSPDGLSAEHAEASGESMEGVVFGDGHLPRFADKSQYFEVRVDKVRQGCPDGLVVGVTSKQPPIVKDAEPFGCADEVPGSWSFGYDGSFISVPGPQAKEQERVKFAPNVSLYRVSRFSQSAFRISYAKPSQGREEEDEDEEEEEKKKEKKKEEEEDDDEFY
mmetsp:Transcript_50088/g.141159  ORF Transcript_50088/g.141159 Transcript_50088/m.141159 type:complete len:476 (+) Transcript_50088:67-1494(+)